MRPRIIHASRADDARLLAVLAQARDGVSFSQISRDMGKAKTYARVLTRRVYADDVAAGDPLDQVALHYPASITA